MYTKFKTYYLCYAMQYYYTFMLISLLASKNIFVDFFY